MLRATSKAFRLHIGFFGQRNVGKSSLLNAVTRQYVSIVSDVAGTTTDPVEKPMELLPIGPVLFVDTARVDDVGALGTQRIEKTRLAISRTDIGVLVTEAGMWGEFEERLLAELRSHAVRVLIVLNKSDQRRETVDEAARFAREKLPWLEVSAATGEGVDAFRQRLWELAPAEATESPVVIRDLVEPERRRCWWCQSIRRLPRAAFCKFRRRPFAIFWMARRCVLPCKMGDLRASSTT